MNNPLEKVLPALEERQTIALENIVRVLLSIDERLSDIRTDIAHIVEREYHTVK